MVKRTRKQKGLMTIPELRKAFDHMESFTSRLLQKKLDTKARRKEFQSEWMRVFHHSVDDKAADAYLSFESKKSKKSGTRRKMRGGQVLAGAPLDYTTRPGMHSPYGVFPAYVNSGFAIYDKINQDSLDATCGQDITPKLPADLGSNAVSQKGGKRSRKNTRRNRKQMGGFPTMAEFAQAVSFRPFSASAPTTSLYDASMAVKGVPPPPPSTAATGNPPYQEYKANTLSAVATAITRDLANEMRA